MLRVEGNCCVALMLRLLAPAGFVCFGCAEQNILPNISLLGGAQPYLYSDRDWAAVLRDHVHDGLVDYDALARNREPLERYYALLSVTGPSRTPDQFPSRVHAVAYYLNAHNALVLCAVMERYPVTTMYDLSLPRIEHHCAFTVDGRRCTLTTIEEELFKLSNGDVRTLLATSRAALGTPQLASEPFRPKTLEAQLARAAAAALDDPNLLRIDHTTRSIFLWQLILRREDEFVAYWKIRRRVRAAYLFNVLLGLSSPQRRRALQSAVGYTFVPMPFNRALNRWSRKTGEAVAP